MVLRQTIDLALASHIGAAGLPQMALDAALSVVGRASEGLVAADRAGEMPLLRLPNATEDLESIRNAAAWLRRDTTDVVFLGTGGSSLGGQALAQLKDYAVPGSGRFADGPRVHFLDNLDPVTFEHILHRLPLSSTRFVAISKSGRTAETLMQTMAVLSCLDKAGLKAHPADALLGLSEPRGPDGRNALRDLLEPEGVRFLDHHPGIGGRYAALTNVGLLPAAVLGLDIAAIRKGAAEAYEPLRSGTAVTDVPAAIGAALHVGMSLEGRSIAVTMAYADRLERFTRWWVQLWAESLGKGGKGSQPVAAIGPVDQHSQLQLYLDGPNDRVFTILTTDTAGQGPAIEAKWAQRAGMSDFAGAHVGDLVDAQSRATIDTLARNGRPVRRIHAGTLDERAFGELLMHFMLETILTGHALGLDPFDQPAVEEGKILARQYLAQDRNT